MTLNGIIRVFGVFAIIGGLLRASMSPIELILGRDFYLSLILGGIIGSLLLVPGAVGAYLLQAKEAGKFGFITFLLTLIGTTYIGFLVFMTYAFQVLDPKLLEADAPPAPLGTMAMVGVMGFMLSTLLYGIATFRANVLPRGAAIMIMLFPILNILPIPYLSDIAVICWGGSYVWLGLYAVTKTGSNRVLSEQPAHNHSV